MTWLVRDKEEQPIQKLRQLLEQNQSIIKTPGTYDPLTGLLAKQEGFQAMYLSGAALTASMGYPDLGLITLTELTQRTREIVRATGLPLVVDADTGFGSVLNVTRAVMELEEAGAAAVQIEDQDLPKKCGHLNGKKLISTEEMVQKIQAAREASSLVIIARTDAKGVEGIEAAIERAHAYQAAGADMVFPEALETEEEFRRFAQETNVPLLANMTEFGRTPYYTARQFEQWGYKMVIYPVTALRIAAHAIQEVFRAIQQTGTQAEYVQAMQTRKQLYETIGYFSYEELDNRIAKTVL
ncbi:MULTISPECIES: methylisocitrate lyase [unclassified Paenibacillus]|uniref:methylisocitrate lyase n=1 Tax=unclassified Paenibacillus TaxID=185978 RepID=UPI001AEAEF2E|nr:methylisocitrate lyase [Paenibacillus sp. PvP091]MBP1169049.1 methylisocitrate lyase [Paenibacillus sp. PvR098]MBP2440077.1 methylisocitrate lyase [Paenibacillus sp. PvP052]